MHTPWTHPGESEEVGKQRETYGGKKGGEGGKRWDRDERNRKETEQVAKRRKGRKAQEEVGNKKMRCGSKQRDKEEGEKKGKC